MNKKRMKQKNLVAQWAFDCRPILGRLHLWLEDVHIEWLRGQPADDLLDSISFTDGRTEKMLAMTLAVTALGTRLFGRYGQGAGLDKKRLISSKGCGRHLGVRHERESLVPDPDRTRKSRHHGLFRRRPNAQGR